MTMTSPFAADPSAVRGAITPLVTPFAPDGALDLGAIPSLVDWQLERGSHGISVGGSTGEPTSQTVAERIEVMRAAAALVVTPYYSRAQQDGLFAWYSEVASEFPDMPIIAYNVPVRAAVDLTPATTVRLRRAHENIVGIKETTRDFEHVSYVLDACGRDFIALSGIELLCYPMLCLGGRGHLSCVANFAPVPVAELYDAFAAGDHDRARRLHYELHPLVDAAFAETNPVPAKWIMQRIGLLESGMARAPLAPLSDATAERVGAILAPSPHVEIAARAGGAAVG